MVTEQLTSDADYREVLFQAVLHMLVLVFYSFEPHEQQINVQKIAYFGNYAAAAALINYALLPRFFYRKRYLGFFAGAVVVVAIVILVEELVLEPLFFPLTRAQGFPGILFTLSQVLPMILILSGFKFGWDALRKQHLVEQLSTVARESELQFLRSQINPHILFNNLNNLYAYAIENSPKTPDLILGFSDFLRYVLYDCHGEYVPLEKEITQLGNYIQISEMQIEERGQVRFVAPAIPSGNYQIAPLILVPFVENAFKHSMSSQSDGICIDMEVVLDTAGTLTFSCSNTYQAQSNTTNLSAGIGLENVKKRLRLLYPDSHTLHIQQHADRYEVLLTLHLHQNTPL